MLFVERVDILEIDPASAALEVMQRWAVELRRTIAQMRTRQSAVRIFAQEYSEASLIEQGLGELDLVCCHKIRPELIVAGGGDREP